MNSRSTCWLRRVSALSRVTSEPPALSRALKRVRAPRDFQDPEDRRARIRTRTEPSTAGRGLGRTGLSPTTTYATTYGRVSTGIYRDLTEPRPSEKRINRDQTGPDGILLTHGTARYESEGRRFESCRARP